MDALIERRILSRLGRLDKKCGASGIPNNAVCKKGGTLNAGNVVKGLLAAGAVAGGAALLGDRLRSRQANSPSPAPAPPKSMAASLKQEQKSSPATKSTEKVGTKSESKLPESVQGTVINLENHPGPGSASWHSLSNKQKGEWHGLQQKRAGDKKYGQQTGRRAPGSTAPGSAGFADLSHKQKGEAHKKMQQRAGDRRYGKRDSIGRPSASSTAVPPNLHIHIETALKTVYGGGVLGVSNSRIDTNGVVSGVFVGRSRPHESAKVYTYGIDLVKKDLRFKRAELQDSEDEESCGCKKCKAKNAQVDAAEDPCWKGYEQAGVKRKNGKTVPNCVPIKEGKN
jgi:hypothetical protein